MSLARAGGLPGLVGSCVSAGYLGFFLYYSLQWDMYRQMRIRGEDDRPGGDAGGAAPGSEPRQKKSPPGDEFD